MPVLGTANAEVSDPRLTPYDYVLPPHLIAKRPPAERDGGRLLVQGKDTWMNRTIRDLPELLAPGDLLVINDTQVLSARLRARRETGGAVELLLLSGEGNPVRAMVRPGRKVREGEVLQLCDSTGRARPGYTARIVAPTDEGGRWVRLDPDPMTTMADLGAVPLPPYIDRQPDDADAERYQTVFAAVPGAVAAPTAGLHLTEQVFSDLAVRGVELARITLHVGPGTFRNLRPTDLDRGRLHPEPYVVPEATAAAITRTRAAGGRVIAVGTTVTRTLESAAKPGGVVEPGAAETQLFIRAGHAFSVVDGLLTNFHLPRTSLLMLVAAFGGRDAVLAGYRHAVEARYRFYSYGDAMFLSRDGARQT